ncbi:MAG: ABC transporter permease, partial [Terriglobales bacterium]
MLSVAMASVGFSAGTALVAAALHMTASPLRFPLSSRTEVVRIEGRSRPNPTAAEIQQWAAAATSVEIAAGASLRRSQLQIGNAERVAEVGYVSPDFFRLFGIRMLAGKAGLEKSEARQVAISESLCSPDCGHMLGKALKFAGEDYEIASIVSSEGTPFEDVDLWLAAPPALPLDLLYVAAPQGARMAATRSSIQSTWTRESGARGAGVVSTEPLRTAIREAAGLRLLIPSLAGLIVCALALESVLSLMLAGVLRRTHEIQVRLTLGAKPGQLTLAALAENLAPVAAGLVAGYPAGAALARRLSGSAISAAEIWAVEAAMFLIVAIAVATILYKNCRRLYGTNTGGICLAPRCGRMPRPILATGGGLAFAALFSTLILAVTLRQWEHRPLGFQARGLTAFQIAYPEMRPSTPVADLADLQAAVTRVRNWPGIEAASYGRTVPLGDESDYAVVQLGGARAQPRPALATYCGPGFLGVIGASVLAIRAGSTPCSRTDAAISESAAVQWFGNRDPIGQDLVLRGRRSGVLHIVAVVSDVQQLSSGPMRGFSPKHQPQIFVPAGLSPWSDFYLIVRSRASGALVGRAVRASVAPLGLRVAGEISGT